MDDPRVNLRALGRLLAPVRDIDAVPELDEDLIRLGVAVVRGLGRIYPHEIEGLEHIPAGPALLVGNHNAGLSFLEPFFLGVAWFDRTGGRDFLRYLAHDALLRLPVVGPFLHGVGGIRAGHATSLRVLARGHKVMVFPGGNLEAFRPWRDRNRVDFAGHRGFLRLALGARVPIVPVVSHGSHASFVVLTRGERLAEALGMKRWLRSEACPIFLGLPWGIGVGPIFHLPVPVPIRIRIGPPIDLAEHPPEAASDPEVLSRLYDLVVGHMQATMDDLASAASGAKLGAQPGFPAAAPARAAVATRWAVNQTASTAADATTVASG